MLQNLVTIAAILLCHFQQTVTGHAILLDPIPRTGMAVGNGIKYVGNITNYIPDPKFPACAEFQTSGPVTKKYVAGETVGIKWKNTIPHSNPPGVTISIQYAVGGEFVVLAEGIDDGPEEATIKLPAGKSSPSAVLRFMWQSKEDGGFYVGCADVSITESRKVLVGTDSKTSSFDATGTFMGSVPTEIIQRVQKSGASVVGAVAVSYFIVATFILTHS
ncbi:hypothetical protein BDR26DRAFT_860425 [Obelidium mucronatum]|nr:hypothetical protein BDR26DRAFT_860425 [Obelidium mucronatum]